MRRFRGYGGRGYRRPVVASTPPRPVELTPEQLLEREEEEKERRVREKEIKERRKIFDANFARRKEYQNLGWANGWRQTPEIVMSCHHDYPDKGTVSTSNRGYENIVICAKCGYIYRYDSSD